MEKKEVGKIGEDLACKFLMKRGFVVIERNYLRKCGEIDIVGTKGGVTHFIEVKTVSRENLKFMGNISNGYRPEDNIHFYKLNRLKRVIQLYLIEKQIFYEWQFHAVTIYFDVKNREAKIEFLENLIL